MLKRDITYTDFNDQKVTETHYFNLTKTEILELEVSYGEGFAEAIQRIVRAEDAKSLIAEFKKIILLAYGIKSDDGRRFIKSEELRTQFSQTAAYDELFIELATDDAKGAAFVNGIMPADMATSFDKTNVPRPTSVLPPPPPASA